MTVSPAEEVSDQPTINPPVFIVSAALLVSLLSLAVALPETSSQAFSALLSFVSVNFGWFYVVSIAFFLAFAVWVVLSPYGRLRLGRDDERPEFSNLSWFAMLFSAGIGIGLVYYGVAEPMQHFLNPPLSEGGSLQARRDAIGLTMFHWGVHAWAIYVVAGLAIAYFAYRKGLPLTLRSTLHPLLGDRIHGAPGHFVDIVAVFGTLFGLATSFRTTAQLSCASSRS